MTAGGALVFAYPGWNQAGLVWVWMLPLLGVLWSTAGKRAGWRGFGLGWLAGLVFFGFNLSWLWTVTVPGAWLLAAYLAVYFGLWGAFAATWGNPWRVAEARPDGMAERIRRRMEPDQGPRLLMWGEAVHSLRHGFANAAVWCALEWARGWVFTGFGWNGLGVAFHETPVLAQAADLLGISGLALLPVLAQAVGLQTARRMWREAREGRWRPHWDFGATVLLVMAVFVYGVWRLSSTGGRESTRLKALLVQLNVPQDVAQVLWPAEQVHMGYEEETLGALAQLEQNNAERLQSRIGEVDEGEVSLRWPDWIVWPETSLTGRVLRSDDGGWGMWQENWETVHRVRAAGEFTLLMGLNELEAVGQEGGLTMKENPRAWNSLVVLPPDDKLISFQKHHLVIFGEYIPLVEQLPFLRWIYEQQAGAEYHGAFARGRSLAPLPVKAGGSNIGVIPSVCFEDTVPRLARKFARNGPQVLVNVTNDGWFRTSDAAAQHFANARFRAIELRRPMIRCANTGVSAAVDARGSVAHPDTGQPQVLVDGKGSHFTRGWILAEVDVPLRPAASLYAVCGDWLVIALGCAGLATGWLGRGGRN